jgi:hypothetical protein
MQSGAVWVAMVVSGDAVSHAWQSVGFVHPTVWATHTQFPRSVNANVSQSLLPYDR